MKISDVKENIVDIYKRMSYAAMRAGREPDSVKLVAVTKKVSSESIKEAINSGLRIFGENYIQEAKAKVNELSNSYENLSWHLTGHLQSNKAKIAVQLFDLIHTLDSIDLARELNKQAERIGKIQRVLVQVNLSKEGTKHGIHEEEISPLLKKISELKNLHLGGLMTMPAFFTDPDKVRPYMRRLRYIRDGFGKKGYSLPELSMGMSGDFEVAIEEGATLVRIGTAIFGERM